MTVKVLRVMQDFDGNALNHINSCCEKSPGVSDLRLELEFAAWL